MKTIRVTISIIALALSGCATGYYQRGYVGYNSGYTAQRYYDYDGYGRSYYSPGTSFIYERSYVQPRFDYPHYEHYRDWQAPMQQPRHFGGGHGDWNGREVMNREPVPGHRAEQAPNWGTQAPHEQRIPHHGNGFGGNPNNSDGGRQDKMMSRESMPGHHAEQAPNWGAQVHHEQRMPPHGNSFGGSPGDGEGGRQHHSQQGRQEHPHN